VFSKRFFGLKCSVSGFLVFSVPQEFVPGLKCSATQKRLGTTVIEVDVLVLNVIELDVLGARRV
jgi:hypothetical protein